MTEIVFFILLFALLCLPFLPGIIEIRQKTDASPLKVIQEYDVDIHYFANVFRNYIEQHFPSLLQQQDVVGTVEGRLEDNTRYFIINQPDNIPLNEAEKQEQVTHSMLVSAGSLQLPGAMSYLAELYAGDSIAGGKEDIYRALLAENDIEIAEQSLLLRWMHAGKTITVNRGSVLHGRVSADKQITLVNQCHFERLYSPLILFGNQVPEHKTIRELNELSPKDLAADVEDKGGRWLIEHDIEIPDNSLINSNLVVVGRLTIGRNCQINGSVKSRHVLKLGEGSEVNGSLVSNKNIHCKEGTYISGPVISEDTVYLYPGAIVGGATTPTTISAEEIHVTTDCVAYGLVWARTSGIVKQAGES